MNKLNILWIKTLNTQGSKLQCSTFPYLYLHSYLNPRQGGGTNFCTKLHVKYNGLYDVKPPATICDFFLSLEQEFPWLIHRTRPSCAPQLTIQQHRMKPDRSKYSNSNLERDLSLTGANLGGLCADVADVSHIYLRFHRQLALTGIMGHRAVNVFSRGAKRTGWTSRVQFHFQCVSHNPEYFNARVVTWHRTPHADCETGGETDEPGVWAMAI